MSSSTTARNVVVVTHVYPVPEGAGHQPCVGIQKFSKGRPLVLGTVQIMVGLMVLLFGIAMAINAYTLGIYSGIFVWGALFYIAAGSLTVAAGKSLNRCLVNAALAVSVVAAVASFTATILYSLDAAGLMTPCYGSWQYDCYLYLSLSQGISGVLTIFHLLELIVSVTVAGHACNATCNCNSEQPSIVVVPGDVSVAAHAPPNSQATSFSLAQLPSQTASYPKGPYPEGQTDPPAYNAVIS